jgi:hypothetical protein
MRIGIDISQIVYEGTGVGTYVRRMVETLLKTDTKNSYILFGASLRKKQVFEEFFQRMKKINSNVELKSVSIQPTALDVMWNRLHMTPVEKFTGPLDIFWSSDWTQPPLQHAIGVTTIHDLSTMRFPAEMDAGIVATHARRLKWVTKECKAIFCDSESTKKDCITLLHIPEERLHVIYPGFSV